MKKHLRRWIAIILLIGLIVTGYHYQDEILIFLGHEWYGWISNHTPRAGSEVKGKIDTITYKSHVLGDIDRKVIVYLPYNYNQVFFTRFPVLYLLHGFAGVPDDWLINAKITDVVEKLIADGKLPPLIIVMPDANGPVIKDSEYIDATLVNQPMESYIVKEIVPMIDDKYRTITEPQGRAIAGISSGAFGAVNLTLRHPDVFHDAISLGGYFINREWPTDKLVGSDTPERRANEPLKYIDAYSTDENLHLYLAYSEIDFKDFISDNLQLDQKLTQKQIDHTLVKMPGVHFWTAWNKQLPDALTWLGGHFRDEL